MKRLEKRLDLGLSVSISRRSRDPFVKGLGLVSVSRNFGGSRSRSRLGLKTKRLGLVSVSKLKVSFTSLIYMQNNCRKVIKIGCVITPYVRGVIYPRRPTPMTLFSHPCCLFTPASLVILAHPMQRVLHPIQSTPSAWRYFPQCTHISISPFLVSHLSPVQIPALFPTLNPT